MVLPVLCCTSFSSGLPLLWSLLLQERQSEKQYCCQYLYVRVALCKQAVSSSRVIVLVFLAKLRMACWLSAALSHLSSISASNMLALQWLRLRTRVLCRGLKMSLGGLNTHSCSAHPGHMVSYCWDSLSNVG